MKTPEKLYEFLTKCWSWDTAYNESCTYWNPQKGQCAVTALIVNDEFGGMIVKGYVNEESHYWNVIPWGNSEMIVDLTRGQFPYWTEREYPEKVEREDLLDNKDTQRRYIILRDRLDQLI